MRWSPLDARNRQVLLELRLTLETWRERTDEQLREAIVQRDEVPPSPQDPQSSAGG
jgi:hypothetical protein